MPSRALLVELQVSYPFSCTQISERLVGWEDIMFGGKERLCKEAVLHLVKARPWHYAVQMGMCKSRVLATLS